MDIFFVVVGIVICISFIPLIASIVENSRRKRFINSKLALLPYVKYTKILSVKHRYSGEVTTYNMTGGMGFGSFSAGRETTDFLVVYKSGVKDVYRITTGSELYSEYIRLLKVDEDSVEKKETDIYEETIFEESDVQIREEIVNVNKFVLAFLQNGQIKTICRNFVDKFLRSSLLLSDLWYLPLRFVAPKNAKEDYSYIIEIPQDFDLEMSPYVTSINQADNDILSGTFHAHTQGAYYVRKCNRNEKFSMGEYKEIEFFNKDINDILKIFNTLCEKHIIDTNSRNQDYAYYAWLYLIAYCEKEKLAEGSYINYNQELLNNFDENEIKRIVRCLFRLVVTTSWRKNDYIETIFGMYLKDNMGALYSTFYSRVEKLVESTLNNLNNTENLPT